MREELIAPPYERPADVAASELIQSRINNISAWLSENAPQCQDQQKHLDDGSSERVYWHCGYVAALCDLQKLLGLGDQPIN